MIPTAVGFLASLACFALGWVLATWRHVWLVKRRLRSRLAAAAPSGHEVQHLPTHTSNVTVRPSARRPDITQPTQERP